MISLIGAMDRNRYIGLNGDMPWGNTMKADLDRFKDLTMGCSIIMGRKTFESLPGVLPGRTHIVLTTQDFRIKHPMVWTANSVEEAIRLAYKKPLVKEVFVIGGAQIYEAFLPYAQRLYLTKIEHTFEGDTSFPNITGKWNYVEKVSFKADENNPYGYTFMTLERGE